ncbi:tetratricopeptide repeat protein [Candidatus Nitronereus thalassa]|uniref:Tetratricopeptide repeat protein n=1 Tax=Candidatus Nitronereus thalassa TaxID=3020898 RepID=A0ABU3KB79_9BACT|nr:tetratricopeptide repeat protein [Candidatus Nitronereus thalassa]MDT7043745.1 tetratricopeptide repeat protein [Candidatus Nitronereus thalassa]
MNQNRTICYTLLLFFMMTSIGATSPSFVPLKTDSGSPAQRLNQSGIKAYQEGEWQKAQEHFLSAGQEAPQSAVVHYNLGLTLHKIEEHKDAAQHFQKAADLGTNNSHIQESQILKDHLEMLN